VSDEAKRRLRIQWTETAKECLKKLPPKVQRGLIDKADELENCDPRDCHKPLFGPLRDHYRIVYARYRAVYNVREEELASGDFLVTLVVTFIACGKREEYSKDDVYRVAQKAVELGLIQAGLDEPPPVPPRRKDKGKPKP
jgi:mRNA-degrading endonuclease RelE of RelBE toxin-antitoxin system